MLVKKEDATLVSSRWTIPKSSSKIEVVELLRIKFMRS
jgi:hypothetical protein